MNKRLFCFTLFAFIFFCASIFPESYLDESMNLFFSGKDAYDSGDYSSAINYFDKALKIDIQIEGRVPNIKFMLGVCAFNLKKYDIARVNLQLFSDNPIAIDLIKKIDEFEKNLPEDSYYLSSSYFENQEVPNEKPLESASETLNQDSPKEVSLMLPILVTLILIAIMVFIELKYTLLSKISSRFFTVMRNIIRKPLKAVIIPDEEEKVQTISPQDLEDVPASFLDTPFEREIDIDDMAAKDVEEISRFFEKESSEKQDSSDASVGEKPELLETESQEGETELSARENILNSFKDSAEAGQKLEKEIEEFESKADEGLSEDYELMENMPDDFDVMKAIQSAKKIVSENAAVSNEEPAENEWKSIEKVTKEIETAGEIKDIKYFEKKEKLDEETLEELFDYLFEKTK